MVSRRDFLRMGGASLATLSVKSVANGSKDSPAALPGAVKEEGEPAPVEVPFLWYNDKPPSDAKNRNVYAFFRRTFVLDADVVQATLRISAGSYYKLYVNDCFVGRGPVREAAPWYQYDECAIGEYLRRGKNVLAIHVFHRGQQTYTEKTVVMGLWAEAEISTRQGRVVIPAGANGGWRVCQDESFLQDTPYWSWPIKGDRVTTGWGPGPQEYRDLRIEMKAWTSVAFDDSAWSQPFVQRVPLRFYQRIIPFLRETRLYPSLVMRTGEIPPPYAVRLEPSGLLESDKSFAVAFQSYPIEPASRVEIRDATAVTRGVHGVTRIRIPGGAAAYVQLDFGRQVCGFPHLAFNKGKAGVVIDLAYGESILQKERPSSNFERTYLAGRVILRDGPQEHTAAFLVHSFQYMGIVLRTPGHEEADLELREVGIDFVSYPVERKGAFRCDDPLYNRIYEVSEWTNRMCLQDLFVDCTRRELVQWVAEAFVQSDIAWNLYGDHRPQKQLLLMGAHQDGNRFPSFYPTSGLWDPGISTYPLFYPQGACQYYLHTGDADTVSRTLQTSRTILAACRSKIDTQGLFSPGNKRQFFDLTPSRNHKLPLLNADTYTSHLAPNCMLLLALQAMAWLEGQVGDAARADECRTEAEGLSQAIKRHFWNETAGHYECGIGGKSRYLSLAFLGDPARAGLMDEAACDRQWGAAFTTDGAPNAAFAEAGYVGSFYLFSALFSSRARHHWLVDAYLRRHYQTMLDQGATTFWEEFDGRASFVHGTSGHFPYFAAREILGVKPLQPGYREFQVQPKLLHLGFAEGSVPTPAGNIEVSINLSADRQFEMKVVVPAGTAGRLVLWEEAEAGAISVVHSDGGRAGVQEFPACPHAGVFRSTRGFRLPKGANAIRGRLRSTRPLS